MSESSQPQQDNNEATSKEESESKVVPEQGTVQGNQQIEMLIKPYKTNEVEEKVK